MQIPRWSSSSGLVGDHRLGGQTQHVDSAHQVDVDRPLVALERGGAVLGAGDPASGSDPGAVDADPQAAILLDRRGQRVADRLFIRHIGLDEPDIELFGERGALFLVEVGDHDRVAGGDQLAGGCLAETGRSTKDDC